ncbi:hypothetical protein [Paenibacillus sp. A14]|uniref:hypothetical protein n=1 Tax=Paenibacillus sp. A14 TaxID=3119820 RepID=UPI002FDF7E6C
MRTYYWGSHRNLLDPVSLRYLYFGAFWYEEHGQRFIVGYGFGDSKIGIFRQFGAPASCQECTDIEVLHEIYREFRKQQQEQDWSARLRLPLLAAFRKPWLRIPPGWYVLKLQASFPAHLTFVHKTKYAVWLEHSAVCENETEIRSYIHKAENMHHVDFNWMNG